MSNEKKKELDYIYSLFDKEEKLINISLNNAESTQQRADLLSKQNLINFSKELLRRCYEFDIYPKDIWRRIPEKRNENSEYRIFEDFESENKDIWKEIDYLRLNGGEVIIG